MNQHVDYPECLIIRFNNGSRVGSCEWLPNCKVVVAMRWPDCEPGRTTSILVTKHPENGTASKK